MEAVHRLGIRSRGKIRPIICRFFERKDVDYILSKAYQLKGTTFGINRDYPREIVEARSKLWPEYKQNREKYKKNGAVLI